MKRKSYEIKKGFPRGFVSFLSERNLEGLVGVELGVFLGSHAGCLLRKLDIKKLYLVDPYCSYESYDFEILPTDKTANQVKTYAYNRLQPYRDRIKWIYETSFDAIEKIPDKVDFVYHDSVHTYEAVLKELWLYYPKVKQFQAGHDFRNGVNPNTGEVYGVKDAVLKYIADKFDTLYVADTGNYPDWWCVK